MEGILGVVQLYHDVLAVGDIAVDSEDVVRRGRCLDTEYCGPCHDRVRLGGRPGRVYGLELVDEGVGTLDVGESVGGRPDYGDSVREHLVGENGVGDERNEEAILSSASKGGETREDEAHRLLLVGGLAKLDDDVLVCVVGGELGSWGELMRGKRIAVLEAGGEAIR